MATALQYTAEQLNYSRISYVVTNILTDGLRTIFKQEWDKRYKTTLGEWKDEPKNGLDFWKGESHRNRKKNAHLLTTMKNGNRAEWDCSMLFYAILYSDCLNSLNPTVQSNVDDLRKFRNEEFAHVPHGHISNIKFKNDILKVYNAFHNLGLATAKIKEIQNQTSFPTEELGEVLRKVDDLKQEVYEKENKLQEKEMKLREKEMELQEKEGQRQVLEEQLQTEVSPFCILPSAPSHDVAPCTRQVAEITQQLKALKGANENCLSILYLSGNPGSGKSQLSRLVAKQFYDEVEDSTLSTSFVMTLNAENTGALMESYVSFARYCKCPEYAVTNTLKSREMDTNEKITNLKALISTKIELFASWLLVVDNVADAFGIHSHLPDAGNKQWARGQMLITTQDTMSIPLTSSCIQHVSISKGMDLEDARFLLKQLSGVTDSEMEKEVAQVLDYQPLAMASAATYVREVGQNKAAFGWIDYLKKLDKGKRRSTERILAETNSSYPKSMTAAITLAVEKAMTCDKVIHHTFSLLSLCASQPILQDIVTGYITETDEEFQDREMVVAKLSRCPLLLFTEDEGCVYIRVHRVVHEVINTVVKCHTNDEHLKVIHGAIASFSQAIYKETDASKIGQDLDPIFLCKNIVPHIKNLITETDPLFSEQGISEVTKSGIVTVQDFTENFLTLGEMCIEHCELKTALKCCNVVLTFVNLGVVGCNKAKAAAYSGLGRVHCDLGKLEQAKDYFLQALDIHLRNFRLDQVHVASSYNNLGLVCSRLGDLQQAKDFYLRAMDIQTKILSPDHDDIATSYHNLGVLHRDLGDLKRAKFCIMHSLVLRIKQLGVQHVDVASTYNELGLVYKHPGKIKKARYYYETALNIYM